MVHDNLTVDSEIIRYIMRNPIPYRSVEYNDNRLSLYIAQNGKCSITKEILRIDEMEVHHKKPRKFGGTDVYCNLTIIHKNVHKLIHAVKSETIKFYLSKLKLGNKELGKMNKLRLEVGNNEIIL
ncbi:group II intron reverse transcriptase/maturase (plasmid) [Bacillus thuringiensis serovar tolworthi]|uniref:Group II intron reverse transcriptase/maturase n=1 Tax=Bacillus thuringiensis subsp. tolworthi TaxID=1442 RepID=A0A9W4EXP5_BACTO|nr:MULTISPECIES: HNH endonuclease signature motif containing protein [Bacillus cereus group]BAR87582.1 group II intron reverse transcriptase/maturase [Bacillus thuringiensis serovar tolworthi]